jgi:primosomal protein N' (replication factor Y)
MPPPTVPPRPLLPATPPRPGEHADGGEHSDENGGAVGKTLVRLTEPGRRVLDVLDRWGEMPLAELCRLSGVSVSPVETLARCGVVKIFTKTAPRSSLRYYGGPEVKPPPALLKLNKSQKQALEAIVKRLGASDAKERSRPILLKGVAGAGKTEVYLRAIEEAVNQGGSAIVLVPEISLTHQAVKRFRRRFGDRVGIIHSGLGLGERHDEYMRIRSGGVDVVIGPRSALFAPLPNLKLKDIH